MIMKLNTYRLSSLEDPTDEQLHALMEQVAVGGTFPPILDGV